MVFYMFKGLPEIAILIGTTVLSNDSNSQGHRSANSHRQPPNPSIIKEASSSLMGLIPWSSICLKDSLKVPY
jgi:hypothetical protein